MGVNNSSGMRMSLPPGTKVQGKRAAYIVQNLICMSERSVTVGCKSEDGRNWRLKFYNGESCVTEAALMALVSNPVKGVILPVDMGVFSGSPFAVFANVQARNAASFPIAQDVLTRKIIPQLAYVMNQYHRKRILLRDMCPEHILYDISKQQIAYCGLNNAARVPKNATITKAKGCGQHHSFVAPEVEKYGYSTCSDYYSLGMTLLCLVRGKNPMASMSRSEIDAQMKQGKVPGIDMSHLLMTSYNLYSEEDRILYLILGLIQPDPRKRWGYGEIRCWCNNQHIPLVPKEGKVVYQYNEPFYVGSMKCWNYKQLTQGFAADSNAWTDAMLIRFREFAKRQQIGNWEKMAQMINSTDFNTAGKIFRCIYAMNPALDGFWWKGKKYQNTDALMREAAADKGTALLLSDILKNRCLSFFMRMRKRVSAVNENDIHELEQIEQWEIDEPGKGVNRCIMRFSATGQSRTFFVGGREYRSFEEVLEAYKADGNGLKAVSSSVLKDKTFQAWLWANGMEDAAKQAAQIVTDYPEQGFYLFLKIAESHMKNENSKRLAREMYMRFGDYAPIYWLANHISEYRTVSISDQILFDVFRNANFSLNNTLDKLSLQGKQMVADYQKFVTRTSTNPLEIKCVGIDDTKYSFIPTTEDGFFCCTWENGIEVCPAFLKSIGSRPLKKTLDDWIENARVATNEKLETIINGLTSHNADSTLSKSQYTGKCNRNMLAAVVEIALAVWLLRPLMSLFPSKFIMFGASLIFPLYSFSWYYRKKAKAAYWFQSKSDTDGDRDYYRKIQNSLERVGQELLFGIASGSSRPLQPASCSTRKNSDKQNNLETLNLGQDQMAVAAISAIGFLGLVWVHPYNTVFAVIGVGIVLFVATHNGIKSCGSWLSMMLLLSFPLIERFYFSGGIMVTLFLQLVMGGIVMSRAEGK